jgi:hypothetical protein
MHVAGGEGGTTSGFGVGVAGGGIAGGTFACVVGAGGGALLQATTSTMAIESFMSGPPSYTSLVFAPARR